MTLKKADQLKRFSIRWILLIVGKRQDYKERLIAAVDDFLPDRKDSYDAFSILDQDNWDCNLADRVDELIEFENIYEFTQKAKNDFICTLRIAVDLLIGQSGGVVGYTIGDVLKFFNNKIPNFFKKEWDFPEDYDLNPKKYNDMEICL